MALSNELALLDKAFLKKLDFNRNKEVYVRLVSLNWDENPIAEITSNVASGSISIDTKSTVRRTCNITLVTNTDTARIDETNWTLRTKFKVFVGVENHIDDRYEDMIWFPQGTFVITSFNCTLNQSGYTLNIQGKDKMCLINGDVGGSLFAAHEFSMIYVTKSDGTIEKDYIPIYDIIREAVHNYAQEPYWNIVINDLDSCAVELIDYIGDDSIMYIYTQHSVTNADGSPTYDEVVTGNNSYQFSVHGDGSIHPTALNWEPSFHDTRSTQIRFNTGTVLDTLFEWVTGPHRASDLPEEGQQAITYDLKPFLYQGVWYQLQKRIDPKTDTQTTAGYRATDLIYNGELMIDIGGTITQMLDKIIQMLGEFEYFYDVNGRFIFQRKRIYFNASWSNAIVDDDQTYYDSVANGSADFYDFAGGYLVESFQNKPQLNVIKNDFSIWGSLTGVNDTSLPIHLRYAIDRKPEGYYSLLDQKLYLSNAMSAVLPDGTQLDTSKFWDWRELIYQMARDNLAARSRIEGLQASLITLTQLYQCEKNPSSMPLPLIQYQDAARYHYSYEKLASDGSNYPECWKWDPIKSKFVLLTSAEEFLTCKENKEFLYGNDKNKRHIELSNKEVEDLNNLLGYDYRLAQSIDAVYNDSWEIDRERTDSTILELYDFFMWLYDYYEAYLATGDNGIKGFEDPDYQLNNNVRYYWRDGVKTEAGQTWENLADTLRLQNQETPPKTYFNNIVECKDVDRGQRWTVYARQNLNTLVGNCFSMGPTDGTTEVTWNASKDHSVRIQPNGTLSVKAILTQIIAALKNATIKKNDAPQATYRNLSLEAELIARLTEQSYVKTAQDELDAWQDTYNTGYDAYYVDMLAFWPQLYRTVPTVDMLYDEDGNVSTTEDGTLTYSESTVNNWALWVQNGYWNPSYVTYNKLTGQIHFNEPEALFFWIEFIDPNERPELQEYAVEIIGRRSKSVNDTNVKAIYVRDTPSLLFINPNDTPIVGQEHLAYARINIVPPVSDYFRISSQGKSAKEALDTMLYESTYFQESVTISSVPIYYLEPNVRISIHDDASGIDGEYLVQSFTIPLAHDGMMSITANRAADRLL